METTFMTIHNLTPEANIMFASESISDILGYEPEDVVGKPWFEYFDKNNDDTPLARQVTSHGVHLEKAAVIYHADIQHKDHTPEHPKFVTCECVFTVVHDVLVACTSVYNNPDVAEDYMDRIRGALKKETSKSLVKRFTVPPKDLRYHMLESLSFKFRENNLDITAREPRAALILNRFTRSLTIMYCTDAIEKVLGISKDYMVGKSFYECIQQQCLTESIAAIESAKGNDSIAHLIFWCRDPRHPHEIEELNQALDSVSDISGSEDEDEGGSVGENSSTSPSTRTRSASQPTRGGVVRRNNRQRSGDNPTTREVLPVFQPIQLEAVISCTSDGLVVILRKAPIASPVEHRAIAPWGVNPIAPHVHRPDANDRFVHGPEAPALQPGASQEDAIRSIRDVAVFAWALCGINGNIGAYGHGKPGPRSQPKALPVYAPYGPAEIDPPLNQAEVDWARRLGKRKETGHSLGHIFREERNERREKRRKMAVTGVGEMRPDGYQPSARTNYAHQDNGYGHNGNGHNGNGHNGNGHNGNGNGTH
ncbi:hypothetical protein DSL72_006811 [Monilinia vaccinii-corymbosi]|uniref:PAS domain-containing protein n=1 Tax=Monilinia vaccinii-corymbosi TaxID=61207 RepID=A0A8A3PL36_9HELO|nr:hypothetical protein DSL72_006811 [Monilinia vaccinii-corymbosi]